MSNQLLFLSLADIFSVYPTIFKELIATREKPTHISLPSDKDWQERVYFRLLEMQRRVNEGLESGCAFEEVTKLKDKPVFDPTQLTSKISPSTSPNGLRFDSRRKCSTISLKVSTVPTIFWSMENIAQAAKLLRKPPLIVHFKNEHEMRTVYSLIYDVFRYKVVLSNALNDILFHEHFTQYFEDQNRTWLMLYELFHRNFKRRKCEELYMQSKLYQDAKVEDISDYIWKYRTHLAASFSRMRIRYKALNLSELLPIHLKNEKVAIAVSNPIVTGWANPFLLRDKNTANEFFVDMGFTIQGNDNADRLTYKEFSWDNVCPLFLSCIPEDRGEFTKSKLMTEHFFIMQDKTFSFGPAIMSKLLDYFELDGDILQTHIDSPRSTAYLAALFYSVNRVNNFYVYGAGANLKDYRKYMENLGITNIRLFAESFTSFPLESRRFGTVVGIFANPPNSFSAISDPIDLICSRGGDLTMLEVLTESEISDDGKHRVCLILEEQLLTLQMAMSQPQIQFILYQTHSIITSENQDMVKYVVNLINEISLRKHRLAFKEKRRLEMLAEAEQANIPSAAINIGSSRKDKSKTPGAYDGNSYISKPTAEEAERAVTLPDCDEFTFEDIPDICINQDNCLKWQTAGCFVSLIKRKNITRLNAKCLIRMAEERGLFGKGDKEKTSKKAPKIQELERQLTDDTICKSTLNKSKVDIDILITRISRPTNCSFIRSHLDKISLKNAPIFFNCKGRECSRYFLMSLTKRSKATQRAKAYWHYVFKCIQQTGDLSQKFGLFKWKYNWYRKIKYRKPYPIFVNEIKLYY